MSRSFRLDDALERRLEQAAKAQGVSVSAFVREAVGRHCDEVLEQTLDEELADVIGSLRTEGGRARDTGRAFREMLAHRRQTTA